MITLRKGTYFHHIWMNWSCIVTSDSLTPNVRIFSWWKTLWDISLHLEIFHSYRFFWNDTTDAEKNGFLATRIALQVSVIAWGQEQNVAPFSVPQAQPKPNNARGIAQRKTTMLYMQITPLKKEHHLLNFHLFMGSKFQLFLLLGLFEIRVDFGSWGNGLRLAPFPQYQWMFHEGFIGMP